MESGISNIKLRNRVLHAWPLIGFFDERRTLKSGRESSWYVNWRKASNDVFSVNAVANALVDHTLDFNPTCFIGVPDGANNYAALANYLLGGTTVLGKQSMPSARKNPKEHGDPADRYFVGTPEGRVVVVEDVTTTATSVLEIIPRLRSLDSVEDIMVVGLLNRDEKTPMASEGEIFRKYSELFTDVTGQLYDAGGLSVAQVMEAAKVKYMNLLSARVELPQAFIKQSTPEYLQERVREEFAAYGIADLIE